MHEERLQIRVLGKPPFPGHYLYFPSRHQNQPAFRVIVDALRQRQAERLAEAQRRRAKHLCLVVCAAIEVTSHCGDNVYVLSLFEGSAPVAVNVRPACCF